MVRVASSRTLVAVEQAGCSLTAADLSARVGCDLQEAHAELLRLAADTDGRFAADERGVVTYLFDPAFRALLARQSWRASVDGWLRTLERWGLVSLRVTVGGGLLVSIALAAVGIVAIIVGLATASNDSRNSPDCSGCDTGGSCLPSPGHHHHHHHGGGGFFNDLWLIMMLSDNSRRDYRNHYDPVPARRPAAPAPSAPPPMPPHGDPGDAERGMSGPRNVDLTFVEAVFSFLFGDGDPNADMEERRMMALVALIRKHGGRIVARQAAPYLDAVLLPERHTDKFRHEAYMVPVLRALEGVPQATPSGELEYIFPQLMPRDLLDVDLVPMAAEPLALPSAPLLELETVFSRASLEQQSLVGMLIAINLGFVFFLALLVFSTDSEQLAAMGGVAWLCGYAVYPMVAYAILLVALPCIRYAIVNVRNARVARRNAERKAAVAVLQSQHELRL